MSKCKIICIAAQLGPGFKMPLTSSAKVDAQTLLDAKKIMFISSG